MYTGFTVAEWVYNNTSDQVISIKKKKLSLHSNWGSWKIVTGKGRKERSNKKGINPKIQQLNNEIKRSGREDLKTSTRRTSGGFLLVFVEVVFGRRRRRSFACCGHQTFCSFPRHFSSSTSCCVVLFFYAHTPRLFLYSLLTLP